MAFINKTLDRMDCPGKTRKWVDIAVDEVFANLIRYAYGEGNGPVTIRVYTEENPKTAVIVFTDNGKPFDPLAVADPDTTLPMNKRPIGGLGIFMLKKMMDDIQYENRDGRNILTLRKIL